MSQTQSATKKMLEDFQAGDPDAEADFWARYFRRVTILARNMMELRGVRRRVANEEDIAQSVFRRLSELRARENTRLDAINTGEELWSFLVLIISGKVYDERRRQIAKRREKGESAICGKKGLDEGQSPLDWIFDDNPMPDSLVFAQDECERLLELLSDDSLRETARLYFLDGLTQKEVAERLRVDRHTVSQRLIRARRNWRLALLLGDQVIGEGKRIIDQEIAKLFSQLPDERTKEVAELHFEGLEDKQIAKKLQLKVYQVNLELDRAFAQWRQGATDE